MKRAAAALAVLASTAAAAPLATPAPSPGPLKEIAAVRARAFCGLSKDASVKTLTALLDTEQTLGDGVVRMAKADTANGAAMRLMINNVQTRVRATVKNIETIDAQLKKLEALARSAKDNDARDAALTVITTLRHDRDVENELMNRMNDYAETYLMDDMLAGTETENQMKNMLADVRQNEQSSTLPRVVPTGPAGRLPGTPAIATTREPQNEYERQKALEAAIGSLTTQAVDVSKASIADLRKATVQASVATDGLLAVCNK